MERWDLQKTLFEQREEPFSTRFLVAPVFYIAASPVGAGSASSSIPPNRAPDTSHLVLFFHKDFFKQANLLQYFFWKQVKNRQQYRSNLASQVYSVGKGSAHIIRRWLAFSYTAS